MANKLTYSRRPAGRAVSDGRLTVILDERNEAHILASIRDTAVELRKETGNDEIRPDKWLAETERLCRIAERIVDPESWLDIFEYLPLTKSGNFPKSHNPLIADSTCSYGERVDGYVLAQRLQLRLVPIFTFQKDVLDDVRVPNEMKLMIQFCDATKRQTPIFDSSDVPGKVTPIRTTYLRDSDVLTGRVYEEKSGTRYLCLTRAPFVKTYVRYSGPDDDVGATEGRVPHADSQRHTYVRWTKTLANAVGTDTGLPNVLRALVNKAGTNSIFTQLSSREKPRKFVREVETLFDPATVRRETVSGPRHPHPWHDGEYRRVEYETGVIE